MLYSSTFYPVFDGRPLIGQVKVQHTASLGLNHGDGIDGRDGHGRSAAGCRADRGVARVVSLQQ